MTILMIINNYYFYHLGDCINTRRWR